MRLKTIVAGAAGLGLLLAGCSTQEDSTDNSGSQSSQTNSSSAPSSQASTLGLIDPGTLTACGDPPFIPFEMEDSSSPIGYTGFDVELISQIAERLDLEFVYKDVNFDTLQAGTLFASGQCDVGASGITITEKRKASLTFSDPYYDSLQSLLVPASSPVKTLDDLSGLKVGVQSGTTGQIYAQENLPADAQIVEFPSDGEEWLAIQAGNVDALLQDFPVNHQHETDDPDYKVVAQFETDEQLAFAVGKDQTALADAINQQLAAMKSDGSYDELFDKYFG